MWKDVKIVHGKPRHSQTQASVERANQDIQNMLTAWMNDNDTNKWSNGLPFVQFAKNTTYHEGICQSLYEAMFGIKPKISIASSSLPGKQIANIETEEQLKETVNTFEENLSSGHNEYHSPKENIKELQSTTSSYQALTEQHKIISIKRAATKENLLLQATKMLQTSKKKFPSAQIGDTVRI
ncbi:KRAB-A domain-containing protein 2-like [Centruroides sculpturatus]|uniref:KRAB-A domain-containing protein 2-like n=1 Tax=Centruroides sculpturatus TaxID=218467 RepID=UPI000C6EC7B4|nr:KRAB-A domain-containing protein 2-like [Centruroides sculpturatus]